MATPFHAHAHAHARDGDHARDHAPPAPEDLSGPALRRVAPFPSIVGRRGFAPLIGALGPLWPLFGHAAGVPGRGRVVVFCLAGAVKLSRRRLRPRERWDRAPGPGRLQPGAW